MNALVSIRDPDAYQVSLGGPHLHGTGGAP